MTLTEAVDAVLRREHRLLTVHQLAGMVGADTTTIATALHELADEGRADRLGEHPVRWQSRGPWPPAPDPFQTFKERFPQP
jgi:hypothetical protein